MDVMVADAVPPKGVCRLGVLEGVEAWAELQAGVRWPGPWPSEARFVMSPDFPRDLKLADALSNGNNFLVASAPLVEVLRGAGALAGNDVHPVAIVNHKGRVEAAPYFLVHQYDFVPCVDEVATEGTRSKVNPREFMTVDRLVLDPARLPADRALFRPLEYSDRPFLRRAVADAVTAAGCTGLEFFEIDEYEDW